jgi:adenosylhomocysteine nucleosidase
VLGVLVGMALEARIVEQVARELGVQSSVIVAIISPAQDARAESVDRLVESGATRIASFGLAGGLDARLRAGDIICPAEILSPDGVAFAANAQWHSQIARHASSVHLTARHAGVAAPVMTVADKVALFAASRAAAADMESHFVAHGAARAQAPFLVLRVIVDAGDRDVPPSAAQAIGPGGRIAVWRFAGGVLRRPWDIPGLVGLGRDMRAARYGLAHAARILLQAS